jgi:hypothetical protein
LPAASAVWEDRKEAPMKIVVIKSPKFFSGILRKIFGMKE